MKKLLFVLFQKLGESGINEITKALNRGTSFV